MNHETFFEQLDQYFAKNEIKEAGEFLEQTLEEVRQDQDISMELSVLNEMMGYYRSTDQKEKGIRSVEEGLQLIRDNGLETHPAVATMWINMGTTLCHFERVEDAEVCYKNAELFFAGSDEGALNMASLYNNTAAVYVKTGRFSEAKERYEKALEYLKKIEDNLELWEDIMFNRLVTWLNIIVMNRVKQAETKECNSEEEKDVAHRMEQIKELMELEGFQKTSSFPYAVKKCAHCFENLGDREQTEWIQNLEKGMKD
jgi:tetratricopeptide (TPR) repeat protein